MEDSRVLGKTVLLSDLPVHREQDPPGAQFFPRSDPEALANLIADAWHSMTPGPDHERERSARVAAEARIGEVGREFLRIAAK